MSDDTFDVSLIMPDLDGIPEDDNAEPEDAGIEHLASAEDVLDLEGDGE